MTMLYSRDVKRGRSQIDACFKRDLIHSKEIYNTIYVGPSQVYDADRTHTLKIIYLESNIGDSGHI